MPSFFTAVGAAALVLPGAVLGAVRPSFPGVAYHALAPNFGCNILGVAEYFSEEYPVPRQCQDHYATQITDFCNEYLNLVRTVYTTTVTPVVTQTSSVTEWTTATLIATEETPPNPTGSFAQVRRDGEEEEIEEDPILGGCSDITPDKFLNHPAFMIEKACRCLPIRFTTVSTASTAAATHTTTTTLTITETVSSEPFSIPTPNCNVQYAFTGNTGDQWNDIYQDENLAEEPRECCERCLDIPECVAAFLFEGGDGGDDGDDGVFCSYVVNTLTRDDTPTGGMCMSGFVDFGFGDPVVDGGLWRGGCGY